MARFIISNLIYDTEKMDYIGDVKKSFPITSTFLPSSFTNRCFTQKQCRLYRSKKGNFLLTYEGDYGCIFGQAISEEEARQLLTKSNYAAYQQYFGDLEEA